MIILSAGVKLFWKNLFFTWQPMPVLTSIVRSFFSDDREGIFGVGNLSIITALSVSSSDSIYVPLKIIFTKIFTEMLARIQDQNEIYLTANSSSHIDSSIFYQWSLDSFLDGAVWQTLKGILKYYLWSEKEIIPERQRLLSYRRFCFRCL